MKNAVAGINFEDEAATIEGLAVTVTRIKGALPIKAEDLATLFKAIAAAYRDIHKKQIEFPVMLTHDDVDKFEAFLAAREVVM